MLPVKNGAPEEAVEDAPGEAPEHPTGADPAADLLPILVQELAAMKRTPPEGVPLPEVRFREELGFDSLDRMEFIARVEQRFRLPLADDEVEGLVTLGHVARLVAARGVEAGAHAGQPQPSGPTQPSGQPQPQVQPSGRPPPPGPPYPAGPEAP